MRQILLLLCIAFTCQISIAQPPQSKFLYFNDLNNAIRDGKIKKPEALAEFKMWMAWFREHYQPPPKDAPSVTVFPLAGYDAKAIGGKNGSGYVASGYDYFDGNRHGGHPAHDIFIHDKNQDCKDDATGQAVDVVSLTEGVVIATEMNWDPQSGQRGGKYIWIYVPASDMLLYYAHNQDILVRTMATVKPGDIIGRVGRTGLNAAKKRSPTHLHLMALKIDADGYPRPVNIYEMLSAAGVKKGPR